MSSTEKESKQVEIQAAVFITFAIATIVMGLRLLSRRLKRIPLSWDDYFAICCYGMAIAWIVIIPYWVTGGLGLHIQDITDRPMEEVLYQSKLLLFIAELFYAAALFFAKLSILSLYWRMFNVTSIRLPIQILFGCSVVWMIFRLFMGIFHCVPVHAFWDSSAGGSCAIEDKKFFFGTTLVHAVIDIAILVLPMMEIGKLQLPLMQKIGIMLMFTFGFFICGAAIVVIVAARRFNDKSPDLTWNICTIVIWATVEVNLVNVSACLPTIRPACKYLFCCQSPQTHNGASSNNYSRSQTKQSIRLDTIHKSKANDESSSTHQLADSDDDRRRSVSDFESHALDRFGNNTSTITGSRHLGASQPDLGSIFGGIMVKNETRVRISQRG
ncbi:Hypothetical protein NCS54_01473600 [Fusarium falciforme]|uniref:Hypothetical protein n=1 Tax=Fusarium falciforme TaxID=195108 RepID=UPI0023002398|nr:Hypothetical protein NCS54_01473600 [Fusarium falciforme]WAO97032.1 Hypothetical protein NCS54_01473600 [Fusarium falciforme]